MRIQLEGAQRVSEQSLHEMREYFRNVPTSFERFLKEHIGARIDADFPEDKAPKLLGSSLPIVRLVKADEIVPVARNHPSLQDRYIPIGDDGGGNYMCISVDDGAVYYLDHDWSEFHFLSPRFEDWLDELVQA